MRFLNNEKPFIDDRGIIRFACKEGNWVEMCVVISSPGVTRGNHYHKETTELFIVISGEANLKINDDVEINVKAGDSFIVSPMERHTFRIGIHGCIWVNALDRKMEGDIHK